jgi:hypothetical protein
LVEFLKDHVVHELLPLLLLVVVVSAPSLQTKRSNPFLPMRSTEL